ncbi:MAG: methyltransferase domain-containing protein [Chloroflexi bacterium]|nr:methyltransferase domain-containing protein [Chloroflexota bacterium]
MDREQYAIMFEVEQKHWWYRGMRRNACALLRRFLTPGRTYAILDAGCGTGGTTLDLREFGAVTGIDMSEDALSFARRRCVGRLVRGSIEQLPISDGVFDVVTSFDVLYHRAVGDERRALEEFRRVLRPGGVVLVRDPAFNWLRGAHDVGIHTMRRFTVGGLAARMHDVGFEIVYASYANMLLFPLAVAKRSAERFLTSSPTDLSVPPKLVNVVFEAALSLERPLARWLRLPVGLSEVVLGRAP